MSYHIIGDVHGHADKLEGLLLKLGYEQKNGVYQQEGHKTIFVGDLIDRGTQNGKVIKIVRNMIDAGHAYSVMGNHEYNAICYHTFIPGSKTDYLRPHTLSKTKQHENFLKEYQLGNDDTNEIINWFKTLPLFLEFDGFRVIHACWDHASIKSIIPFLNDDNTLREVFWIEAGTKGTNLFNLIEILLKGLEIDLPDEIHFQDKDGTDRTSIRVKWWKITGDTYTDIAFGYDDDVMNTFPLVTVKDTLEIPLYGVDDKPVFFGHYWITGNPVLQQENLCCLDYSAGKGKKLVCYTFNNPEEHGNLSLNTKNFCYYNG